MALSDYKITNTDIQQKGVVAAPDKLIGTARDNKMIFDRLVREIVKSCLNGLIDELEATVTFDADELTAEEVDEMWSEVFGNDESD